MNLPQDQRYQCLNWIASNVFNGNANQTAKFVGCSYNTVRNAMSWSQNMTKIIKPGPEPMIKEHHLIYILAQTQSNHYLTNKQLADMLMENFNDISHISENTVGTARHKSGLIYAPPRKTVLISESKRKTRINWCLNHLNNKTNFQNVIFTDESWFELGPNRRWLWRSKSDYSPEVCSPITAHPKKVMIWGGIGWNFKSRLVFIDEKVDASYYWDEILLGSNLFEDADNVFGVGKWVLQQDNARPHISNYVIQNLDYVGVHFIDDWPPYSPDLNIIEFVWGIMKRRLEQKNITTIEALKEEISNVWESLTLQTINSLVESLPKRLSACVQNNGFTVLHY